MVPLQIYRRRFMRDWGVSFLCSTALLACKPWYLVESHYQAGGLSEPPPEITATPTYRAELPKLVSIAISAPDKCADRSSAETTGEAKSAGELLRTTCGVEMAELERALVRAGYRVISWNAIRQMVVHEENVTPLKAARSLGANVLLQVNSMERSTAFPGHEERWEREFFESDRSGTKGPLTKVPEERARALEQVIRPLEVAAGPREQLSVSVNGTAVLTATGEAIWFYAWTHHRDLIDSTSNTRQLVVCQRKLRGRCLPWTMLPAQAAQVSSAPRSGSSGSVSVPQRTASEIDALYYQLIREVVADLAFRFSQTSASE